MMTLFEIREKKCTTRPDLMKYLKECKDEVLSQGIFPEDLVEVHFQTTDVSHNNGGYVIGCRVETPGYIYYYVFDDADKKHINEFTEKLNSASKFSVPGKIKLYTTSKRTKKEVATDKDGKPILDANGEQTYVSRTFTEKSYVISHLKDVLDIPSSNPINKDRYVDVLKGVYNHYKGIPDDLKKKLKENGLHHQYTTGMNKIKEHINTLS